MWCIRLSKGEKVKISIVQLPKIREILNMNPSEAPEYVDIDGQMIKRSFITGVVYDDDKDNIKFNKVYNNQAREEIKVSKITEDIEKWKEEQLALANSTPEEKAACTVKNKFPFWWFARTSNFKIPQEIKDKATALFIEYFKKNPAEPWGEVETVERLISNKRISIDKEVEEEGGFVSIGSEIKRKSTSILNEEKDLSKEDM